MKAQQRAAIAKRMAQLEATNGGRLTPAAVVADAKKPKSPMHDCFNWDQAAAAEAHWLDVARDLIASVRVTFTVDTRRITSVCYVRDPTAEPDEQGYVSIKTLRKAPDSARDALIAEFNAVASLLRRAREIAVALDAQDDVEDLLQRVVGLRQRFMQPQPPMQQ